MRIPIFQLEHKKTYKEEYQKILKIFLSKCISYDKKDYNYFEYMNEYIFHNWKYRDTYLDCYEYLDSIGINIKTKKITKEGFINFLEFILNMQFVQNNIKRYSNNTTYSIKCKSIITHNIPVILESYNYEAYSLDDRIILIEKDTSYDIGNGYGAVQYLLCICHSFEGSRADRLQFNGSVQQPVAAL